MQGNSKTAGGEYEWRLRLPNYFNHVDRFPSAACGMARIWPGKTLLVHAEQGLGDSHPFLCAFCRWSPKMGGKIILEVQSELVRLMKQTKILEGIEIVPAGKEIGSGPAVRYASAAV